MDYGYLIALFLLLNIFSFCSSNQEENEFNKLPLIMKSASFILQSRIQTRIQTQKDTLIALETYQRIGFWNSEGYNCGRLEDPNNWYYVRKGLWGEHTISLESSTKKGYFFRLSGSGINLEKYENSAKFKEDASFIPTPGIEDYFLLSLRPLNSPKSYVRHYKGKISNLGHKLFDDYDRDVTWRVYTYEDFEGLD